ncbi:MAG: hypothetical protein FRX49_05216 [Trebouxia sp. A1-2]|nr:MAG: hypothetical protein FRX49_05216 [Trebouxia sp. A1-2]
MVLQLLGPPGGSLCLRWLHLSSHEVLQGEVSTRDHTQGTYHLTQTWTFWLNQSQTWTCCISEPPMAFVQLAYYFDAWLAILQGKSATAQASNGNQQQLLASTGYLKLVNF